jgi:hypothetical protein
MPWPSFRWMGTTDLKAIYAYLKQVPAVANPVPNDIKGPFAAGKPVPFPTSFGDGDVSRTLPAETPTDALFADRGNAIHPLADPAAVAGLTAAEKALYGRGSYLVAAVAICSDCHTNPSRTFTPGPGFLKMGTAQFLTGGAVFAVPPGLDALTKTTRTMSANLLGKTHGFTWDITKFSAALTEGKFDLGTTTRPIQFPMPWQTFKNMVKEDVIAIFAYLKTQKPIEGTTDKATQGPAVYCTATPDCDTTAGETCNTATKECIGRTCAKDADCGACQTCTSLKCAAPAAASTCLTAGI